MKKTNQFLFRYTALLILFLWMPGIYSPARAQDFTDKRSVSRRFPASMETTLEVENKYGKMQVVTWDKDSVAVDVAIFLSESSVSRLRKLKADIKIDFTTTNSYIIARTKIASESGRVASELRSITHTITGTNKRVEINYLVHVPAYLDVVLNNKFGDIYMDDLEGEADITLSNGVLKANRLYGHSSISLSFASGMIKSLGSSSIRLSYSDLVLDEVSQLDLDSRSSKLNVDSVNVLKINSRRDKLYFKKVEYFYGESNFSQVWVYDFLRESDIYMKYGEVTIEHVMPGFSKIYVESEYTDITLFFEREATFNFNILHHEKAILRLPDDEVLAKGSRDGKDYFKTVGSIGPESSAAGGAAGSATDDAAGGEASGAAKGVTGGEAGSAAGDVAGQVNIDALQKCYINIAFK